MEKFYFGNLLDFVKEFGDGEAILLAKYWSDNGLSDMLHDILFSWVETYCNDYNFKMEIAQIVDFDYCFTKEKNTNRG